MEPSQLIQFRNCRLLRDHKIIEDDLWVRNGKIEYPEKIFYDEKLVADIQINCKGALISPGFIDLQINGGFGIDFSDMNDVTHGISKVAEGILSHGVTAFCPTVVTSPVDVYKTILPQIQKKPGGKHGATILGLHLEGPFINIDKKGAHPEEFILRMDKGIDSIKEVYGSLEHVSIITIAPELDNSCEVIKELSNSGITVSLGHSVASLPEGEEAVKCGANFITHLFNAMLPFHHRDPGLVGLLASKDLHIFYGIICDGIHTHPAAIRIAQRTNPTGLVLVTDAIAPLGLGDGKHHLGQMAVEVNGKEAVVAGTGTLCGSIASMPECIKIFQESADCSIEDALEAATLHPAQVIGTEDKKGTLAYGADADLVFLSDDLDVWSTWIAGECVFQAEGKPEPEFITV